MLTESLSPPVITTCTQLSGGLRVGVGKPILTSDKGASYERTKVRFAEIEVQCVRYVGPHRRNKDRIWQVESEPVPDSRHTGLRRFAFRVNHGYSESRLGGFARRQCALRLLRPQNLNR